MASSSFGYDWGVSPLGSWYRPGPPVINVSPTAKVEVRQQQQEVDRLAAEVKELKASVETLRATNRELIEQRNAAERRCNDFEGHFSKGGEYDSAYARLSALLPRGAGPTAGFAADEIVKLRAQVQDLNAGRESLSKALDGCKAEVERYKQDIKSGDLVRSWAGNPRYEAIMSAIADAANGKPHSPASTSHAYECVRKLRAKFDAKPSVDLSAELAATKAKLATAEAFSEENRRRAEACKSVAEGRGRWYPFGKDSGWTVSYPAGQSDCVEAVVQLREKYDKAASRVVAISAALAGG